MATQARPGGEIQNLSAGDRLRMVEHIAGERLAAGPGEGPERRRQADSSELLLGLLPKRQRLVREVELYLGHQRRRDQSRVLPNEKLRIHGQR